MRYRITRDIAAFNGLVEISEAEYQRIVHAHHSLAEVLLLEENFDLVTENYYEYELELISIALRHMIFHGPSDASFGSERRAIVRRIVNLLTACRMYLDQCVHHISEIYGSKSSHTTEVKSEKSSQYDQRFGYRVMEALRNHVQHRGFPVHVLTVSWQWQDIEDEARQRLHHTVIPSIRVAELVSGGNFKQAVLKEMQIAYSDGALDIRPLVRDYILGISMIHERIRELCSSDVVEWENILNEVIKQFQERYGEEESLLGLVVVAEQDDHQWAEQVPVLQELSERRNRLLTKNRWFENLDKRIASNEIRQT